MTSRLANDEWLMAQVAAGKRDHLEPLVRRHADALLTFIYRMTGDRHRSEEVFQEVFLAVWTKRRLYEYPRKFKAWLYAIAVNKCHALYRGLDHGTALASKSILNEDGDWLMADGGPSPPETAIATETASLVLAAVAQLPPRQRAVVVLRIWEGLSYAQIAEVVEGTEVTVRSHMHHGLATLRRYLEPKLAEG